MEGPFADVWTLPLSSETRSDSSMQEPQIFVIDNSTFAACCDSDVFGICSFLHLYFQKNSNMTVTIPDFTVGVLALQGAFSEHVQLLRQAAAALKLRKGVDAKWEFIEVRTPQELARCEGLIIPGGESTTMSLVAARSGVLEPLREFVKYVLQWFVSRAQC